MKKRLTIIMLMMFISSTFIFESRAEETNFHIEIDGEQVVFEVQPFMDENNRTLVPVRFIAEKLGSKVDWNGETRTVSVDTDSKSIKLVIDQKQATVNGTQVELDTKAIIRDSRTFVPLRFIAETMGLNLSWNESVRTVELKTEEKRIKNITEFASRPITDFIDQERPYVQEGGRKFIIEDEVHISSYSDLPLVIGDEIIYSIEKTERGYNEYLVIKTNTNSSSLKICYIKKGLRKGAITQKVGFLDENGAIISAEKNADGTYNFFFDVKGNFDKYEDDNPKANSSDYIVVFSGKHEKMVLIDNVFKK